ncbi:DoxX family membrane protein [Longirhabdus pacifica]|uniref:DoxX family membrane protein n=1 Tax=Longirhabdus pacifica TaxID=2305227 RepID=UPI0010090680|nr:DoxX family membrane protein [Longirhabdus pacifica]
MKTFVMILQILLGVMFLFFGFNGIFEFMEVPEYDGTAKLFMDGLVASEYMFPFIGVIEIIAGIGLIFNVFVPLVLILIFPIVSNMVMFHIFLELEGIGFSLVLFILVIFFMFVNLKNYKPLFKAKKSNTNTSYYT